MDEPKALKELDFWQGWLFGLGFMSAVFVFSIVIVPLIICSVLMAIAYIGAGIGG